ncbi:MAG: GNAT family N-acetyltransferase [Bacteroidota bacterium]
MKDIISPVPVELIKAELTEDRFVRKTNKGGNLLYIITANDSPNTMMEIGRLREETFRFAGGGTGKAYDIDDYDTGEMAYKQLIVWDPDTEQILGGYRFHICSDKNCIKDGAVHLATSRFFNFSDRFVKDYLPHMIELGRSFVQPAYQSTNLARKGLYALDNLWDGLGTLVMDHPDKHYFFGKVTMYTDYHQEARNMILYFLEKHFPDHDDLVRPIVPLETNADREKLARIFTGKDYVEDYKILSKEVRERGEVIPPLINAYMNLSPSMKTFGTVMNTYFGNVEETAILININDLYKAKIERHLSNYIPISLRRIKNIRIRDFKIKKLFRRFRFNRS